MSSASASEMVISILAKALIFLKPLYFKLKNGCQWWRQLMASKRSRKQWCSDLICFLLRRAILNLSVCLCATIDYCLGGGHERWLLLGQLSLMFMYTWVHTCIRPEWVDADTPARVCARLHKCNIFPQWNTHSVMYTQTNSDVNLQKCNQKDCFMD